MHLNIHVNVDIELFRVVKFIIIDIDVHDGFCMDFCHHWRVADIGPPFIQIQSQAILD